MRQAATSFRELLHSFAVQRRVIFALLMREILTRYGRHNIGFLWVFVEPMIFTLGITALWTATKSLHGSQLPIVAFALSGYSSVLLWRNMPGRCIGAILPNLALMYHRNVKLIDIFAARLILEFAGASISFIMLGILFGSLGWLEPPENVLEVLEGWFILTWFGSALAIYLGSLSQESELVEKLWHPVSYLTFPLSGAAFMVDVLPKRAQELVLLLPMVHGVEIVREGWFGSLAKAHYDVGYVVTICLFLTLAALSQLVVSARNLAPM